MTQEEKAKAYDEVLKKARMFYKDKHVDNEVNSLLEVLFPELKESEKIRNTIFDCLYKCWDGGVITGEQRHICIAWLEKQGDIDKTSYEIAEKEKREFVGGGFIKCYADFQDFKERETYWLEYVGNDNYNVRSDNLLGKTYHITPCQLYTIFKKQTWLEKKGEQKETLCDKCKKTQPSHSCQDITALGRCALEKQGEQKLTEFEKAVKQIMEEAIECGDTHNLKADAEMLLSFVHNSAWSEEDKNILNAIAYTVKNSGYKHCIGVSNEMMITFIKSLKDRVQPQKQWKPSDEQMDAINDAIDYLGGNTKIVRKHLMSLYEQLKKLKAPWKGGIE